VVIVLAAFCALYLIALGLALRAKRSTEERPVSLVRIGAFFLAMLLVAILLLSPINTIARTQLFSMHMAQAVALTTVCAPLVIFGWSASMLRLVDETPILRSIIHFFLSPLVASILFNASFLLWHAPNIFAVAMVNPTLYHIMMLNIFFASILNWWPLIGLQQERQKLNLPLQMAYAFFDGQPVDIFAFVLVFSGVAIYPLYTVPHLLILTAFGDQTVAGAILLIPGLVDLGVMSPLFMRWLGQMEQHAKQEDQRRQRERELAIAYEEDEYEEYEEYEEEEHKLDHRRHLEA
jgi:cytochrome c oxidase assembly factor CtaG